LGEPILGAPSNRLLPALIAAVLLVSTATASSQTSQPNKEKLIDENLLVALPDGFKIDFQQRAGDMLISEMVPVEQSVNDWTEMVTVQVFHDLKTTPERFKARVDKEGPAACAGIESHPVAQGDENGYPYMVWLQSCPLNKATGKPEITWFKAIAGNDSFYVVQLAFKAWPSKEQVTSWMHYLGGVKVCDTRLPGRACPNPSDAATATGSIATKSDISASVGAAAAAVSAAAAAAHK
jgi:hypothetical protein